MKCLCKFYPRVPETARITESSPLCHQDQEVPSPLCPPAHPAKGKKSYSETIRTTFPSTTSTGKEHLVWGGEGNWLYYFLYFFFIVNTQHLVLFRVSQIPISCCGFRFSGTFIASSSKTFISLLFLAKFCLYCAACANESTLFKISGTFHEGNHWFLRNDAAHIRKWRTFLAIIVHFPDFSDENTASRLQLFPQSYWQIYIFAWTSVIHWWSKNYYITCRPLGPDFPTGPGIPLKTETSG